MRYSLDDSAGAQDSEEFLMEVVAERASINNTTAPHDPEECDYDADANRSGHHPGMPGQLDNNATGITVVGKERVSNLVEEDDCDQFTIPYQRHTSLELQKMAVELALDTAEEDEHSFINSKEATTMKSRVGAENAGFRGKVEAKKSSSCGKFVADPVQPDARKRALRYVEQERRNSALLADDDEALDNNDDQGHLQEPDLQHGHELRYASHQRPGAYAQSPGEIVQRNDTLSFSRLIQIPIPSDIESGISPFHGPIRTVTRTEEEDQKDDGSSDSVVVEAKPVTEENTNGLEQAQPVNLEAREMQKVQQSKKQRHLLLGMVAIVVMTLAAGISTAIILSQRSQTSEPSSASIPPTQASILRPNNTQSSEPPSWDAETLLAGFPNYTLESLQDPFSTQSKAFRWLTTHPEIMVMEEWRKKQLFALACIYHAFNGPNWPFGVNKDWLDGTKNECYWYSSISGGFLSGPYKELDSNALPCNKKGEYRFLVLEGGPPIDFFIQNAVTPPEISFLTSLESVKMNKHDFRNTSLSALIPSQLALVPKLTSLQFSFLNLGGTIPTILGSMTNLIDIDVAANRLTGSIPTEIGALSSMRYLDLYQNNITGPIPTQFGGLTSLLHLDVSSTLLTGSLPAELGSLVAYHNLSYINLNQSNRLSGTVADEFCHLKPPCNYPLRGGGNDLCAVHFECSEGLCGCECPCSNLQDKIP